jgi:hypothetical protein
MIIDNGFIPGNITTIDNSLRYRIETATLAQRKVIGNLYDQNPLFTLPNAYTTITLSNLLDSRVTNELDLVDEENYDIVVPLQNVKSISVVVKISSITKYEPKISVEL